MLITICYAGRRGITINYLKLFECLAACKLHYTNNVHGYAIIVLIVLFCSQRLIFKKSDDIVTFCSVVDSYCHLKIDANRCVVAGDLAPRPDPSHFGRGRERERERERGGRGREREERERERERAKIVIIIIVNVLLFLIAKLELCHGPIR